MLQIVTKFYLLHLTPSHAGCKYFVLNSKVHAENFSRQYICVCIATAVDFSIHRVCNHVIAVYSENKLQHYATAYRNHKSAGEKLCLVSN